jgi:hypothetical protein
VTDATTTPKMPEAMPMSVEAHVAVQTVELRHVRESLERIEDQIGLHVTRTEWEQRNGYVDGRLNQLEAQRAPWWVVLGAGLGIISAVVAVISITIR